MSETKPAESPQRKPSTNKNIKKLRALTMVCSLTRSWQQWACENEDKQAAEPTGWAPACLDEPSYRQNQRQGRAGPAERKPQGEPQSNTEAGGKALPDPGGSRIKTKQVVKTVTRDAQERSAGIEFLANRICQDPVAEDLDKMLSRSGSPTRRRKCSSLVSELTRGWKAVEKERKQVGEDRTCSVDSGFSEAEERSLEAEVGTDGPADADGSRRRPEDRGSSSNEETAESWVRIKMPSIPEFKKHTEEANKINTLSKNYSAVGNLKSRWQSWSSEHSDNQKLNPFSEDFDYSYSMSTRLRPGDEGYGRPKEGTKTAERAMRAEKHIHREIDDMCFVIRTMADPDTDGLTRITFGELFDRYVRISDKVVGILMRARKHGKVAFEGEMLWQGQDDGVIITLLV